MNLIQQVSRSATVILGLMLSLFPQSAFSADSCEDKLIPQNNVVSTVKKRSSLNREDVLSVIRTLNLNQISLNVGALDRGNDEQVSRLIEQAIGRKIKSQQILGAGQRIFGSWDMALVAAGIDPSTVRLRRPRVPFRKLDLVAIVQRLDELDVSLKPGSIVHSGRELEDLCLREFGYPIQGRSFFDAAEKYHGSWYELMKKAGIPRERWFSHYGSWSKEQIISAIRILDQKGFVLGVTRLRSMKNPQVSHWIESVIGRRASGAALVVAARKRFGSWHQALAIAGVDPESHNVGSAKDANIETPHLPIFKNLTDPQILQILRLLDEAGVNLDPDHFVRDESALTLSLLTSNIGLKVSSFDFYLYVKWRFLGWNDAIAEARLRRR